MLARLFGADQIFAPYEPFAPLERVNPLLRRELELAPKGQLQATLEKYDDQALRTTMVIHMITICGCCWAMSGTNVTPILALTLPSLAISIGTDLYASVRTIFRWQGAVQQETWDTLRMALRDDQELIDTYEVIGNVRSWSAFRLDMTMRAVPAGIAGGAGAMLMVSMAATLIALFFDTNRRIEPAQVLALIIWGLFLIRLAILYVSDPLWRFRTNTMWSLLCALLFRERAAAIAIAVAGSVGARLVHLGALIAVTIVSGDVMAGQTFFTTGFNYTLFIVWFAVLTVILLPSTRWAYGWLYNRLRGWALFRLRSGDV